MVKDVTFSFNFGKDMQCMRFIGTDDMILRL